MARFVKLINDTEAHKGNPIYLNVDHITAVYEVANPPGGFKTFVFGGFDRDNFIIPLREEFKNSSEVAETLDTLGQLDELLSFLKLS